MERAIRRWPQEIARELDTHRHTLTLLREMAAECAARDIRSFVVMPDGTLQYDRPIYIPDALKYELHSETLTIHALERELHGD